MGGYEYETRYYDEIDDKKKLESYRAILIEGAKDTIKEFCQDLFVSYIQPTGKDIQKQLDRLVEQKWQNMMPLSMQWLRPKKLLKKSQNLSKIIKQLMNIKSKSITLKNSLIMNIDYNFLREQIRQIAQEDIKSYHPVL